MHIKAIGSLWESCFKEESRKRYYYLAYTVLFLICVLLCFFWFLFTGRSLIWEWDGWDQYIRALVYYSQFLKNILRSLLSEHRLVIQDWDFYIGEGSDIINTLHYYVLGDPVAFLSLLVPSRLIPCFIFISCILRMYIAGIVFSELCFGTGVKNRYGTAAGSLTYVFCYWAIHYGTRYTYFMNPMIYLPLMILGIERVIRKKSSPLLIVSTALCALSSFYFFYITGILTAVYTVIRLIMLCKKDIKELLAKGVRILLSVITGVLMAGMLFLPVIMFFTGDSRFSVGQPFHLFYSVPYYGQLPGVIISGIWRDAGLHLGVTVPAVITVFLMFADRKKNMFLIILLAFCCLITVLPIGGRMMNGMSYPTNRWAFAFALLCAYILANQWESMLSLNAREWRMILVCSIVYYCLCFVFDDSRSGAVLAVLPLFFISLMIIGQNISLTGSVKELLILAIVIACIFNTSFWTFSPGEENFVSTFKESGNIWDIWSANDTSAMKILVKEEYPRYSGVSLTKNANMNAGISNTQYYWSISNPYVNKYRMDLEMREPAFYDFEGYDDRTTPNTLAGVGYFVVKTNENKGIPYGYELMDEVDVGKDPEKSLSELKQELQAEELSEAQIRKVTESLNQYYSVYENNYSLPLGYVYDSFIPETKWEEMNPVQKQEAELTAAYIDSPVDGLKEFAGDDNDYQIPFTTEYGDEINRTETGYVTTSDDVQLTFNLPEQRENCETYLEIKGLDFKGTPEYDLYFGKEDVDPRDLYNKTNWRLLPIDDQISILRHKIRWEPIVDEFPVTVSSSAGVEKSLKFVPPDARFSSGRHDYIINMGYKEEAISALTLTFPKRGVYSVDSFNVYSIPMGDEYAGKVERLKSSSLDNIQLETDKLSGDIQLDTAGVLCVAIPYSKGWRAYVDGKDEAVICVNEHYIGAALERGYHKVEFSYDTPYKKQGLIMSFIGILLFICILLFERRGGSRA